MYPSEELKELQAKIDEYEEHLQGTTDPADRTALLKVLASMREEKVLIMRGIGRVGGGSGGGTAPEAKTIEMMIPALLHGDEIIHAVITFDGEESFKDYLRSEQCGGLVPVDEQKTKFVVNSFAHLQPEVIYTHSLISGEAFAGVLEETRRLQQSRLDEFARALTDYAQRDEPDQGYELRENLRIQLTKDKRISEHDVVVKGKDKAYIGSHKALAKGAKPVKEIAERCEELAKFPNELPAIVKPAFMVERPEPEFRIQKACTDFKVLRFRRSGNAIQVVSRMGAAGRLSRY